MSSCCHLGLRVARSPDRLELESPLAVPRERRGLLLLNLNKDEEKGGKINERLRKNCGLGGVCQGGER